MQELSTAELYKALEYTRTIDEANGRAILERFQQDQPALAVAIFSLFPKIIAEKNQDMAHFFMDLCFDVISVYQHAFGNMPKQNELSQEWLEQQAKILNVELQFMMDKQKQVNQTDKQIQAGLINFMDESIDDFASENSSRMQAVEITQTMIAIVNRLFNNLYDEASTTSTYH